MLIWFFGLALNAATLASDPVDFWQYWGDGKAEVASYKVTVPRYNELREGYSVLVFVTEDFSRSARVKIESDATPKSDRTPVLKLNRVVKFTTGIYDYSVLTSTFSSVESELGHAPFTPLKISFSAQEWCGHVFEMLIPQRDRVDYTLHSYFQSEGDRQQRLQLPANAVYEDNLPIWIRELKGDVLAAGERRDLHLMPSFWQLRSRHREIGFQSGWIEKAAGEVLPWAGRKVPTWRWQWQIGDRTETYWVERDYPHRILKWQSSDGSKGELLQALREPYWGEHGNADIILRDKLEIPR